MPCYDGRDREPRIEYVYKSGISPSEYNDLDKQNIELGNENTKLEGMLCAIMNELDRRDIAESIVTEASRNGLIGLSEWWAKHKNDDKARLSDDFHKRYSKDEQAMIKQFLNNF